MFYRKMLFYRVLGSFAKLHMLIIFGGIKPEAYVVKYTMSRICFPLMNIVSTCTLWLNFWPYFSIVSLNIIWGLEWTWHGLNYYDIRCIISRDSESNDTLVAIRNRPLVALMEGFNNDLWLGWGPFLFAMHTGSLKVSNNELRGNYTASIQGNEIENIQQPFNILKRDVYISIYQ